MDSGEKDSDKISGLKFVFRALRHSNYRLFFLGQGISLIGTWMQQIALNWLVYRLTGSAFLLGIVGFTGRIPTFIFGSLAGALADRLNRHRTLIATQILSAVQASVLAILVLTETITVWQIIALSIVLGFINALDMPTRQSFVVDMIDKREDLGNAIALNSSLVNGARLVGPSVAGILIALVGEGMCFLINALSFIAVIGALLAMKIEHRKRERRGPNLLQEVKEGFSYAFGFPPIQALLLLLGLVSLMGMPFTVLMPIFAGKILKGGPQALGFLMGAMGTGALAGTLYLATRRSVLGLERVIAFGAALFGAGLICFSLSRSYFLSLLLMLPTGFGMIVEMTSTNTVLQTLVEEEKRGRVMSFHMMAIMGMVPFGSLLSGTLASHIGAPGTVMISGVACVIGAVLFARKLPALRPMVRPIYVERGIIKEAEPVLALGDENPTGQDLTS